MYRLILLTFAFLGWAFFEMSGGTDFQPRKAVEPPADSALIAKAPPAARPAGTGGADGADRQAQPAVLRDAANMDLTLVSMGSPAPRAPATEAAAAPQLAVEPDKIALVAALNAPADDAATRAAAAPLTMDAPAPPDLRQVKGNRVNMRNGPGTNYGVLGTLARGEQVVVLRDNGSGWVKLRVEGTNRVGWMAEFLLMPAE